MCRHKLHCTSSALKMTSSKIQFDQYTRWCSTISTLLVKQTLTTDEAFQISGPSETHFVVPYLTIHELLRRLNTISWFDQNPQTMNRCFTFVKGMLLWDNIFTFNTVHEAISFITPFYFLLPLIFIKLYISLFPVIYHGSYCVVQYIHYAQCSLFNSRPGVPHGHLVSV